MRGTELPLLARAADRWPQADSAQRAQWPVVLVTMPFMDTDRPSIQLGLLAAILQEHRFPVRTLHANLDFAARIGIEQYHRLADQRGRMVADWLFSVAAFGPDAPDPGERLLDDFADDLAYLGDSAPQWRARLIRARDEDVPAYLDDLVETFPWDEVRVAGFSSTFQQNAASFALARRLKQRYPGLTTVFGGANFDGAMGPEWVRTIDCVDIAVVGEADTALPRLMHALATGTGPDGIPGVAYRDGDRVVAVPPEPPLLELDSLPMPDYGEFFDRADRLGLLPDTGPTRVRIPFESARGCWWGAKHHCTFCGLNGATMQFRAKSPERVADELAVLARRYRTFQFEAVDNIVDMSYLTKLFPLLSEQETGYEIFYEVKANLSRSQVRALAHGGVSAIQPGLESMSTRVLELMRKGVRAAQNVNLLRWSAHYGIAVAWNIIWGFPGEEAHDYAQQAALLPHLVHLEPPSSAGRVWIERFSPLYGRSPGKPPEQSYQYVYPPAVDLGQAAYFFEYDLPGALPDTTYDALVRGVADWQAAWKRDERPVLRYWAAPGFVQIYDGRHPGKEGTYTFEGALADLYTVCSDRPISAKAASERLGGRLTPETVQAAFTEYHQRGLMFLDGTVAVALALPAGPPR